MSKSYYLKFGTGSPANYTGLTPTFTIFCGTTNMSAYSTIMPPGITEVLSGTGLYFFNYSPTLSIVFLADGGSNLSTSDRYIVGSLDPVQAVDQSIGMQTDSFGSTLSDPSTLMGYAKRGLEFNEGNKTYTKSTGTWDIYSRGSSTLLREKALTNTVTSATSS